LLIVPEDVLLADGGLRQICCHDDRAGTIVKFAFAN
jgi:hypothetical protein